MLQPPQETEQVFKANFLLFHPENSHVFGK